MKWILIGLGVGFVYLFTWALCRAAALADREMERWRREQ